MQDLLVDGDSATTKDLKRVISQKHTQFRGFQ